MTPTSYAGLPFVCTAKTLPVVAAPLEKKNFSNIAMRVNRMRSIVVNGNRVTFMTQRSEIDMAPPAFSGIRIEASLGADVDGQITIVQDTPYSGQLLSLSGRLEVGRS